MASKPASRSSATREGLPSGERRRLERMRRNLLLWFETNRRDYPWRKSSNWFHVLMAEMMLRRTRADQVLPAYRAFTARFNTAAEAAAEPDEVRRIFSGLGLNWRNESVLSTLDYLKDNMQVRRLASSTKLRDIPGVGEYSEGMLRSLLFGDPMPAVDVNVVRILTRFLDGLPAPPRDMRRDRLIIERAAFLANWKRPSDVNLALIDMGALLCRPARPRCMECPLRRACSYGRDYSP